MKYFLWSEKNKNFNFVHFRQFISSMINVIILNLRRLTRLPVKCSWLHLSYIAFDVVIWFNRKLFDILVSDIFIFGRLSTTYSNLQLEHEGNSDWWHGQTVNWSPKSFHVILQLRFGHMLAISFWNRKHVIIKENFVRVI